MDLLNFGPPENHKISKAGVARCRLLLFILGVRLRVPRFELHGFSLEFIASLPEPMRLLSLKVARGLHSRGTLGDGSVNARRRPHTFSFNRERGSKWRMTYQTRAHW